MKYVKTVGLVAAFTIASAISWALPFTDGKAWAVFVPNQDVVWKGKQVLGPNGPYPHAGIYEFKSLTLGDNVKITTTGISHLVIKVQGTLKLGKNTGFIVRNGYYPESPPQPISNVTALNLREKPEAGGYCLDAGLFCVYENMFGLGGNGGAGQDGLPGVDWYDAVNDYSWQGIGGSGGGGGGGGYGGGLGGTAGRGAVGTGGSGLSGQEGSSFGARGGYGGMNYGMGEGGGATGLGLAASTGAAGSGGSGGGGNGGENSTGQPGFMPQCDGRGGDGGGGGGYGGGVLTIIADTIVYESTNIPRFLVSGQAGGYGAASAKGQDGEGGLLIMETGGFIPKRGIWSLWVAQYDASDEANGGHGILTGNPRKIFYNGVDLTNWSGSGKYTLGIDKSGNEGDGLVESTPSGIACGSDCEEEFPPGTKVTLTATPLESSVFSGWSGGDCSGTGDCTLVMKSSTTVKPVFGLKTFRIETIAHPGGRISPADDNATVKYGGSLTMSIIPDQYYKVSNVLVDGASIGPVTSHTFVNVTNNHRIEAFFELNKPTILATASAHGTISPSGLIPLEFGDTQTFTMTPDEHSHIEDVLVDGVSVGPVTSYTFENVWVSHTIEARFALDPVIIIATAGEHGTISPKGVCPVGWGTDQTFAMIPEEGYHVANILVDGASVGPLPQYTFQHVTIPHTIWVTFAINIHTITATAGEHGAISPSGAVQVVQWQSASFTITPEARYRIKDVLVDGESVGAVTSHTFSSVVRDHTIAAGFEPDNAPPVADAGPDQEVGELVTVLLSGSNSTDPDDGILTWKWEQVSGPAVVLSDAASPQTTFTAPDVSPSGASLTFKLTVADTWGYESSDTCIVNVTWVNEPPKANAGLDKKLRETATVRLDGSLSADADDGIASWLWEQVSGPPVVLEGATTSQPSFKAPDVGIDGVSLSFQLTVTDQGGLQAADQVVVTIVWVNEPPDAVTGPDVTVKAGETVLLDGTASTDPDDGISSSRWSQVAGPPVTLEDPLALQTRFVAPEVGPEGGMVMFLLTVFDQHGLFATDTLTCNVMYPSSLGVTSPNGSEAWPALTIQTIRWTWAQDPGPFVKIELLKGKSLLAVVSAKTSSGSGGQGSYKWFVPKTVAPGSAYRIRVLSLQDGSMIDTSDGSFTIAPAPPLVVRTPNGGESLKAGTEYAINWVYTGTPGSFLKIDLLKGEKVIRAIAVNAPAGTRGKGSFRWVVPVGGVSGSLFRVRISSPTSDAHLDLSDGYFSIVR